MAGEESSGHPHTATFTGSNGQRDVLLTGSQRAALDAAEAARLQQQGPPTVEGAAATQPVLGQAEEPLNVVQCLSVQLPVPKVTVAV